MTRISSLIASLSLLTTTDAFLVRPHSHPSLNEFADAQLGKLLDIRLDIQSKVQKGVETANVNARMALQGPIVKFLTNKVTDLHQQKSAKKNAMLKMPVANGPNSQLSSGSRSLDIVKDGFVVDMNGRRPIPFEKGSWEMVWQDGHNSGFIVCAFDLPEAVSRNQASIPACQVFIRFPVWTTDTLMKDQAYKRVIDDKRRGYEHDKEEAVRKWREATDPITRVFRYHGILQVLENLYNTPKCDHIPSTAETIELQSGLVLRKRGTVWSKVAGKHHRLGDAMAKLCEEDLQEAVPQAAS